MTRTFIPEYTLAETRCTSGKAFLQLWVRPLITIYAGVYRSITLKGDQHKKQRKMMNPVFSINYMREQSQNTIISNFQNAAYSYSYSSVIL